VIKSKIYYKPLNVTVVILWLLTMSIRAWGNIVAHYRLLLVCKRKWVPGIFPRG